MSEAANHSINPGFITVIVISRPPASSLQDVKKQGGRIILIQHSDQISFKSNFLLHLLRRCSSKTELGHMEGQKFLVHLGQGGDKGSKVPTEKGGIGFYLFSRPVISLFLYSYD